MSQGLHSERGSALVELAIVLPVLLLILCWAVSLTDVLLLHLKATEAARFALWETTVGREPGEITNDVRDRFADLRSAEGVHVADTGLVLYPSAKAVDFDAQVDEAKPTAFSSLLRPAFRQAGFNTDGRAEVRVAVSATHGGTTGPPLLLGGGLLGAGAGAALPPLLANLHLESPPADRRPLTLVFDTWKAWPRAPMIEPIGGSTARTADPLQTYPVVEEQVTAQLRHLAFGGLAQTRPARAVRSVVGVLQNGLAKSLLGGPISDPFSVERMDGPTDARGPVTIRPVELPPEPWAARLCDVPGAPGNQQPCQPYRLGDVLAGPFVPGHLSRDAALGWDIDRTRSTVPYVIQTDYWGGSGGLTPNTEDPSIISPPSSITEHNGYVRAFACRGHFFAGSVKAQEHDPRRRYRKGCL